ncbi:MAG: ribonuclease HII [Rhodospirillaceae bacterium]|nr:ribonuclease HII [Rhodospirillaceae bacterium]
MPSFRYELEILGTSPTAVIAGVDEAGRGPWAGPVVAGAAILNHATLPDALVRGLDDSKKLSAEKREALFEHLKTCDAAICAIGIASVDEIDRLNILQATYLAMSRAVDGLGKKIDTALVDGNRAPPLSCRVQTIIKGDGLSLSIAAASIAAKVTRDRIMMDLAKAHPGYGWETNMGYGTAAHQRALSKLGVTPHHRRSFAPIRALLS